MALRIFFTVAVCLVAPVAALRRAGNVPKGECHDCEVTCFEDCVLKYDREIIQADQDDAKAYERAKRAKGAALLDSERNGTHRARVFAWRARSQNATTTTDEVSTVIAHFAHCLEEDKCPGHHSKTAWGGDFARQARANPACLRDGKSALVQSGTSQCSSGPEPSPCSRGCSDKAFQAPSLLETAHVPLHPVKVNAFATGKQRLEECFKSCLAATCGCQDAPGFEKISKLAAQIKANDEKGDPVEDTPPEYNFRPAFKDECAGGAAGMKITKGLYSATSKGWLEVCTEDFLAAMKAPGDAKEKCGMGGLENEEYGCLWNEKKGACVWGLRPVARCSIRYQSDTKL